MAIWLAPKKAAKYLKDKNPNSMISEGGIRKLIKDGYPAARFGNRYLIEVESFDETLSQFIANGRFEQKNSVRKMVV